MRLRDYLSQTDIGLEAFARAIGVTVEALRRYRTGDRLPAWDVLVSIETATRGLVTPNDFLPLARARERAKTMRRGPRPSLAVAAE